MEWGRVRLPWTEEEGGDSPPPSPINRCRGDGRRTGTGECVEEPLKSAAGAEGWRLFDSSTSGKWGVQKQELRRRSACCKRNLQLRMKMG